MYYFAWISDGHMDHSMHTLDIKYRKEFRKVLIKVQLWRKKCEKVQNMYSSWQFSRGGVLIINTKVYIYAAKVEWAHFIITVQVFALKCSFYFKKRVLSFVLNKSTSVSQAPPSWGAVWLSTPITRVSSGSWQPPYSSTRGVPLEVAPFFFRKRLWAFRDFTIFILTSNTSWMAFRKQWKL